MAIYKWPNKLAKEGDAMIRNFIWCGNENETEVRRITVKWDTICAPLKEGGMASKETEGHHIYNSSYENGFGYSAKRWRINGRST
ncbi:hypothetical protein FRX31_014887 [Thalictrum thalictroides]|uniref:Uncharacterized protein n=1 Tax=Thalictrum thalictroides TaxID=46969 RepID=A0A7J6WF67_THATH|nr:hypothetical protein FRX31_014887 [Thalictrum thalictroides]